MTTFRNTTSLVLVIALGAAVGAAAASWRVNGDPTALLVAAGGLLTLYPLGRLGGVGRPEPAVPELAGLRRDGFYVLPGAAAMSDLVSGPAGVFLVESAREAYDPPRTRAAAQRLSGELGVPVTPVISLSGRRSAAFRDQGAWVVGREHLLGFLREQRNETVEFERLAQLADAL